nr:hypothetical protein HmN_000381900 [Hymenolepis microstoma]
MRGKLRAHEAHSTLHTPHPLITPQLSQQPQPLTPTSTTPFTTPSTELTPNFELLLLLLIPPHTTPTPTKAISHSLSLSLSLSLSSLSTATSSTALHTACTSVSHRKRERKKEVGQGGEIGGLGERTPFRSSISLKTPPPPHARIGAVSDGRCRRSLRPTGCGMRAKVCAHEAHATGPGRDLNPGPLAP